MAAACRKWRMAWLAAENVGGVAATHRASETASGNNVGIAAYEDMVIMATA